MCCGGGKQETQLAAAAGGRLDSHQRPGGSFETRTFPLSDWQERGEALGRTRSSSSHARMGSSRVGPARLTRTAHTPQPWMGAGLTRFPTRTNQ